MHCAVLPSEADLGRDQHAVALAAAGEGAADDPLGLAEAVGRRRVDQGDPVIERGVDGVDGVAHAGAAPHPAADRPSAEADPRACQRGIPDPYRLDHR